MTLNKDEMMLIMEALHAYKQQQNDAGKRQIEDLSMKLSTELFNKTRNQK